MEILIDENELKDLAVRLCELGESMKIPADRFVIMVSMASKYLSDAQGIEVHAVNAHQKQ